MSRGYLILFYVGCNLAGRGQGPLKYCSCHVNKRQWKLRITPFGVLWWCKLHSDIDLNICINQDHLASSQFQPRTIMAVPGKYKIALFELFNKIIVTPFPSEGSAAGQTCRYMYYFRTSPGAQQSEGKHTQCSWNWKHKSSIFLVLILVFRDKYATTITADALAPYGAGLSEQPRCLSCRMYTWFRPARPLIASAAINTIAADALVTQGARSPVAMVFIV